MEGDVLKIEETAKLLKVSTKIAIRLITSKSLKASKLGRSWRIRKFDIDDFLDKSTNQ